MKKSIATNRLNKNIIIGSLMLMSVACFLHTNLSDVAINQNVTLTTDIKSKEIKDSRIPDLSFAKQIVALFTRFVTAK